jgi:hypothetical protein
MSEGPAIGSPPAQQGDSSAAAPAVALDSTFELLFSLIHPSKRIRTQTRKTKNTKPVSEDKGPFNVAVDIEWVPFLGIIAEKLSVQPSNLTITSFVWHWLKPASGPWLPMQDENGLASMLKKIKSKKEPYIIMHMQAPVQKKAAGSSGNAWDVEDDVDSDFEDNTIAKKVRITYITYHLVLNLLQARLDDVLEEIVMKITLKYLLGVCPLHPDLSCFHHRPSNSHFKLDRLQLLVWAQAIKSGSATYEKICYARTSRIA